jgi:hypothetical protein
MKAKYKYLLPKLILSTKILPDFGFSKPSNNNISVVFPVPEDPIIPIVSYLLILKLTFSTTLIFFK